MANPDHVKIVKRGAEAIATWQEEHPDECLDLSGLDLSGADLTRANLSNAKDPRPNK